jgi:ribosomal protein L13E
MKIYDMSRREIGQMAAKQTDSVIAPTELQVQAIEGIHLVPHPRERKGSRTGRGFTIVLFF